VADNYETPKDAWECIVKYFPKNTLIYDPFYFNGNPIKHLKELGYENVYHKDEDAFKNKPPENSTLISNPPYSIKSKILDYYDVVNNKVALIMPLETLERKYMLKYRNNFQILIPPKRYAFNGKKSAPFKACWFCWNLQKELGTTDTLIWG